jgi:hypothetical protein
MRERARLAAPCVAVADIHAMRADRRRLAGALVDPQLLQRRVGCNPKA